MTSHNSHAFIQLLPHKAIDKTRWDECVAQACNSMLYGRSAYLDAMSPGWDALILGDYEAIMPVTWRSKWGIRYVCQPAFTQQLGVFYKDEQYKQQVPAFLEKLGTKYPLVEIFLNHNNAFSELKAFHQNFILDLQNDYETIRKNYSNILIKNLKRATRSELQYQEDKSTDLAIMHYKNNYRERMSLRQQDYQQFSLLAQSLMAKGNSFVRKVCSKEGEIVAISLLLKDEQRIYNITSATLPKGKNIQANHFLMDRLINEFAGSGLMFDFEGSDLPGVAEFYLNFGPINQPYCFWKYNKLPAPVRWLKRQLTQ